MATPQSILSRAIFVYSLPPALLTNLSVRSIQDAPEEESSEIKATLSAAPAAPASGTLRCHTCPGAGFETVEEQRAHFKSDWHRYNAKAKLTGRTVGAEEWEGMVEGESRWYGGASLAYMQAYRLFQARHLHRQARKTLNPNQSFPAYLLNKR